MRVTTSNISCSFLNVLNDQILPYHLLKFCLEAYRKDYNNDEDPFISPLLMDKKVMSHLPPVRIIAGSSDPLRDDSLLFLKKLM
jgi:hormone-sensitive lipase